MMAWHSLLSCCLAQDRMPLSCEDRGDPRTVPRTRETKSYLHPSSTRDPESYQTGKACGGPLGLGRAKEAGS